MRLPPPVPRGAAQPAQHDLPNQWIPPWNPGVAAGANFPAYGTFSTIPVSLTSGSTASYVNAASVR